MTITDPTLDDLACALTSGVVRRVIELLNEPDGDGVLGHIDTSNSDLPLIAL
jgi:hypothetical protein